jgi:carbon-monoxide dehydrogenase medium subunit
MKHYDYFRPTSLAEALALSAGTDAAAFVAGGTDLMVRIRDRRAAPGALISLRSIPELRGVSSGGETRIGAATTIGDIARDPSLAERYPVLVEAALRVGGPQIRNAGTVGGNLCNASPCADTALPLLVLEARLALASARGNREVRLEDFFRGPRATCLDPAEIVTHVVLPAQPPGARAVFLKKSRVMMDLAVASVCVLLEMDGDRCAKARVAAGSVAPTPVRLTEAESILEGKRLSDDVIAAAAAAAERAVSPITDVRSTADYRRHIVGVFTKRAIAALLGRGPA